MQMTTTYVEATEDATIVEVIQIVDVKDLFCPRKTLIVEWLDERHYRSVMVEDPGRCLKEMKAAS